MDALVRHPNLNKSTPRPEVSVGEALLQARGLPPKSDSPIDVCVLIEDADLSL